MKLKQVTLSGFKSFCDETDLTFKENGITLIIGPNGCGKSNVVDAIRWVLGEQSPRHLRGSAMGDVIFSGSTTRKPINRGEVTLLFDNSDATALEKYREFAEIAVTRRLYRDGESEYLINKLPCRLLDVKELFMDTGASGRSYSIVEQGRVEEFISASPQERRGFMEDAAGITLFKNRRTAAEKKLEQTRQNLLRAQDILAELQRQEGALREQMEKAKEYLALKDQAALYGEELARVRHERSAAACAALETSLAARGRERADADQELARINAQLETLTLEKTRVESELHTRRESLSQKANEINESEKRLIELRGTEANSKQWILTLSKNLEEYQVKTGALGLLRQTVAAEHGEASVQAKAIGETIARQEQEVAALQARQQAHAAELKTAQDRLMECQSQIAGMANQTHHVNERLQQDERRQTGLASLAAATGQEVEACRAALAARRAGAEELRAALGLLKARSDDVNAQAAAQAQAAATHRARQTALERETMETRARLKSLRDVQAGYQGFGESVRELLQALAADPRTREDLGVLGPLGDLLRVPAELLGWAGSYLGAYLEVIVVNRSAALARIEEFASARKLTGLRFVALDALPPLPRRDGATLAGHLGVPPELEALREALFGAVKVLERGAPPVPPADLAAAAPGTEWISADGRFHVDGKAVLTLGKPASPAVGLLRRRQEIEGLQSRLDALDGQLAEALAEGRATAAKMERLAAERKAVEQRHNDDTLALKQTENEIESSAREEKRLAQVHAQQESDRSRIAADLERYRKQLADLAEKAAQRAAEELALRAALIEAQGRGEQVRGEAETAGQALTASKLEHGRLTQRVESLASRMADVDAQAAESERRRDGTQAALGEHTEALARAEQDIAALTQELTALQKTLEQMQAATREMVQGVNTFDEQRTALVAQVKTAREALEQAQGQVVEVEKKLAVEQERRKQWEALLPPGPPRPPAGEPMDEKTLERRLNAAQSALAKIEGVNLAAPEEYEQLTSRMTFLTTEKADLEKAIEDLEASIRKMNQESRRRFKETFDLVNEKFRDLFPRVFGGGEASLVLTDSDDPLLAGVDIVAQPPGKKLQNLNLLSGGEKALTAISLIFSFFLIKPSPFCLLDEVDAPLDDVNVGRFNKLIQGMTDHSQFIIITHNKRTMEIGDLLYGVTMEEAGVSKIVSVSLQGRA
jgi:chromosome segregation protein